MKNALRIGGLTVLEFGNKTIHPSDAQCIVYCKDSNGNHYILHCQISSYGVGCFVSSYDIRSLGNPQVKHPDWKRNFYKALPRDNYKEIILNKKDYMFISHLLTCNTAENVICIDCHRTDMQDWYYYRGFRCEKCIQNMKTAETWKY